MKNYLGIAVLFLFTCFLFSNQQAKAQSENIIHMVTWKMKMPDGGTYAERDSLLQLYFDNVTKKNTKILSSKTMFHFFSANSAELIQTFELASLADIELGFAQDDELMKKWMPDEKARKEFNKKLGSYFDGHADGIYSVRSKISK